MTKLISSTAEQVALRGQLVASRATIAVLKHLTAVCYMPRVWSSDARQLADAARAFDDKMARQQFHAAAQDLVSMVVQALP